MLKHSHGSCHVTRTHCLTWHYSVGWSLQVRREFLDMLAEWLLELPERAEHRPRLLPYLLALLADPAPALAAAAADALGTLGAQYEREHVTELKARGIMRLCQASVHVVEAESLTGSLITTAHHFPCVSGACWDMRLCSCSAVCLLCQLTPTQMRCSNLV